MNVTTDKEFLKQCARILVKCGYATEWNGDMLDVMVAEGDNWLEKVDPFAETVRGQMQLKALRKWCKTHMRDDWYKSVTHIAPLHNLKAIKKARVAWCLERKVR